MSRHLSRRNLLLAGASGGALLGLELFQIIGPGGAERAAAAVGPGGKAFSGNGRSGIYVQTGYGTAGDFALILPNTSSGLVTTLRLNDSPGTGQTWSPLHWTACTPTAVEGASATWSNYGHLEVAQVVGGGVQTWWRDDTDTWHRFSDIPVPAGQATGWPALVQTTFGVFGDFHAVVPLKAGGLFHAQRLNDTGTTWQPLGTFGSGVYQGVAMIQSSYGTPAAKGNLELVAVTASGSLEVWVKIGAGGWQRTALFGSGLAGGPALVQSAVGTVGNFEVVLPIAAGGLCWFTRDNSNGEVWSYRGAFGGTEKFAAAGLTIGPYGPVTNNNLEAVGVGAGGVSPFFRDSTNTWFPLASPRRTAASAASVGSVDGTVSLGMVGILSAVLPTGKLLLIGFSPNDQFADADYRFFDPGNRSVSTPPFKWDTFCAGMETTGDGTLLIAGGHSADALPAVITVDPVRGTQRRYPNMPQGRWYPTVTTLADGRSLVIAGSLTVGVSPAKNTTYQVWDPQRQIMSTPLPTPVPFSGTWPAGDGIVHWYPFVYQLPDGRIMVHSRNSTRMITNVDTGAWAPTVWETVSGLDRTYPHDGSAAVLPLRHDKGYAFQVLVTGGTSGTAPANGTVSAQTPATATCELFTPATGWRSTQRMISPRVMHDCVLLPDGRVLAVGGGAFGHNDAASSPVMYAEIFDPGTETWEKAGEITVPRGYHATAVLQPDGAVAIAGRDAAFQPEELQYLETRLEVFKPSYLFKGARPTLAGTPVGMTPGGTYTVRAAAAAGKTVKDVVLMRAGSTTHGNNMGQRMVTVPFTVSAGAVTFTLPGNANLLPPGGWILFVVDSTGVPSPGQMTRLTTPGAVLAPRRAYSSVPATITQSGGSFTLRAAGKDIWDGVDEYASVYQPAAVKAGGSVTAKVDAQTGTDPWAKAGVFLRNDATAPGSAAGYVVLVRTPGNGVSLQWDTNGNGFVDTFVSAAPGQAAPVWLRLTRTSATQVTGAYSTNGTTWTTVGTVVTVPGTAAVQDGGVLMTSHAVATGTAVFSNLAIG